MAPSVPRKKHVTVNNAGMREMKTRQMKETTCKTGEQAQKPDVEEPSRTRQRRSTRLNARIEESGPARRLDHTLPKDEQEGDAWARKVYNALRVGPKLHPKDAGEKAWEFLRSTDKIYRSGPVPALVQDANASLLLNYIKDVTFAQHMKDMVQFIYEDRVKSDIVSYTAEDLLMKLQNPNTSIAAEAATELDPHPDMHKTKTRTIDFIDLTMDTSDDEADEKAGAGGDSAKPAENSNDGYNTLAQGHIPTSQRASGGRVDLKKDRGGVIGAGGSSKPATKTRTAYVESDPFWRALLEARKKAAPSDGN